MKAYAIIFSGIFIFVAMHAPAAELTSYLRIGGIEGDAREFDHQNWFEIISLDQGPYRWTKKDGTLTFLPRESGSSGEGKLTITRYVRKANPDIYRACANGTFFGTVHLDIPIPTGSNDKFLKWALFDVMISAVNIERTSPRRGVPIEHITFTFENTKWKRPVIATENPKITPKRRRIPYRKGHTWRFIPKKRR